MSKTILFCGKGQMLSLCSFFARVAQTSKERFTTTSVDSNGKDAGDARIVAAVDAQIIVVQINPDGLPAAETLIRLAPLLAYRTLVRVHGTGSSSPTVILPLGRDRGTTGTFRQKVCLAARWRDGDEPQVMYGRPDHSGLAPPFKPRRINETDVAPPRSGRIDPFTETWNETAALLAGTLILIATPALADKPGRNWLSTGRVEQLLQRQGYRLIEIEPKDGKWEGEAIRNGRTWDFKMNPWTGRIIAIAPDVD